MGKISCEVGVTPDPNLPAGFAAECRYEPANRQLHFPNEQYGLSPGPQIFNIVHEATHALFDRVDGQPTGTNILAVVDETAAFLAQAIYSLKSPYFWGGGVVQGDPIDEALKLAGKITDLPNALRDDRPPYRVPLVDLIPLQLSIRAAYKLVGGAAGIQHVYNGVP